MNSEKKIKKNTPQIKKNEVVFSNNVMKPSPNINNIVLKSSLATKNEEININNSNFEESKKKSNFKRDISQSNSSNRILNNFKKDNNIKNINKYVKNNINLTDKMKKELEKDHLVSSNSNSSNNLTKADLLKNSDNKGRIEVNMIQNINQIKEEIQDKKEKINSDIQINTNIMINNPLNNEKNTIRKNSVIQLNIRESSEIIKKEEFLRKDASHFNSVYPSNNNNIQTTKTNETSLNKKDMIDNKKLLNYEKEIASLKAQVILKTKETKEKDRKISIMENKIKNLQKENIALKEKSRTSHEIELSKAHEKIHQLENQIQNQNQEISYSEVINRLQNNNISINEFFGRFPEMREMFNQDIIFEDENNEDFPNPDVMSYEELLELEEKIGNVDKGFKIDELEKIAIAKYNKEIHKLDKCIICQYDLIEEEMLRKLTCGHYYHKDCVDEWLLKDKKCPVCKSEVRIN